MSNRIQKNLRALDLNLLPILRELLYAQSVSKAAERLNMSQPAVSEALGRLRIQFGDELLVRSGRKMVITPFAEGLTGSLDKILSGIELLTGFQRADKLADIEQKLVIATADSALVAIGVRLINYLSEYLPRVRVQFIDLQNFDQSQLKSGEVDFAIAPSFIIDDETVNNMPLYREDFVCISRARHPKMRAGMTLEELNAISKVGFGSDPKKGSLRVQGPLGWEEQLLIAQMTLLPYLVENSDSVALIQRHIATKFKRKMNIEVHEIEGLNWKVDVHAFWGSIHENSYIHEWIRERLRDMLDNNSEIELIHANKI